MIYVFRLTTVFAPQPYKAVVAFSKHVWKKCLLVGVISMSQRRDPRQYLRGEPESPVSPQSTFPGQEIIVGNDRWMTDPWLKLAHEVKKSGVRERGKECCAVC
jgi:hypothetical protein